LQVRFDGEGFVGESWPAIGSPVYIRVNLDIDMIMATHRIQMGQHSHQQRITDSRVVYPHPRILGRFCSIYAWHTGGRPLHCQLWRPAGAWSSGLCSERMPGRERTVAAAMVNIGVPQHGVETRRVNGLSSPGLTPMSSLAQRVGARGGIVGVYGPERATH
jgi:hypothetical protein